MNDNLLGRVTALALILGAVYGVHAISRGGLGCPLAHSSCCMMPASHGEAAADEKAEPAGTVEKAEPADEDAKLRNKEPVVPPAPADQDD